MPHNLEVMRIKIPVSLLHIISTQEKKLLIQSAHIINDLALLQRVVIAHEHGCRNGDENERDAQIVLWHSALLILAGKLWEAWEAVRWSAQLWRDDMAGQTGELSSLFAVMAKFFTRRDGKVPKLKLIRNKAGFHYDSSSMLTSQLDQLTKMTRTGEGFDFIGSSNAGNTIILFSEQMKIYALLDLLFEDEDRTAQHLAFHSLIVDAAAAMSRYLDKAVANIFGKAGNQFRHQAIDMRGRPSVHDLKLPFLLNILDTAEDAGNQSES